MRSELEVEVEEHDATKLLLDATKLSFEAKTLEAHDSARDVQRLQSELTVWQDRYLALLEERDGLVQKGKSDLAMADVAHRAQIKESLEGQNRLKSELREKESEIDKLTRSNQELRVANTRLENLEAEKSELQQRVDRMFVDLNRLEARLKDFE